MTQCDEAALRELLNEACTPRLARLDLNLVGRGFGDKVTTRPPPRVLPSPHPLSPPLSVLFLTAAAPSLFPFPIVHCSVAGCFGDREGRAWRSDISHAWRCLPPIR